MLRPQIEIRSQPITFAYKHLTQYICAFIQILGAVPFSSHREKCRSRKLKGWLTWHLGSGCYCFQEKYESVH